jgi:hypothetical protein
VPSLRPQRGHLGPASRVRIVVQQPGQRQGWGGSHDQGRALTAMGSTGLVVSHAVASACDWPRIAANSLDETLRSLSQTRGVNAHSPVVLTSHPPRCISADISDEEVPNEAPRGSHRRGSVHSVDGRCRACAKTPRTAWPPATVSATADLQT